MTKAGASAALKAAKAEERTRALARRAGCEAGAGAAIAHHILHGLALPQGSAIAATWPLPSEIDLRPLFPEWHARGHRVVLPQTPPRGEALIFRRWSPGVTMIAERFGTAYPDAPFETPDTILVPLLAFDRAGGRLGYGGGYYDRTLAALHRVPRVGFAYAAQEIPAVPMEQYDILLGMVITEHGIIRTAAAIAAPMPLVAPGAPLI